MAGLTITGFEAKRYQEILTDLNTNLQTNLGKSLDTSATSVIGIQNSIIASQLADVWELAESVYDGSDILKAEGEQLDNLALLQGIVRLPSQATRGIAWFTGKDGVGVETTTVITSLADDDYSPEESFTIGAANCISTLATFELLVPYAAYQIIVDGVVFSHTSSGSDTLETIREVLYNSMILVAGNFTPTKVGTNQLRFDAIDDTIPMKVSSTSYITFSACTTPAIILSKELGFISGDAFSITEIGTPINGWTSVVNPTDLNLGRNEEEDIEFRSRILETYSTIGASTPDTIIQRVLDIENVQSANIFENDKWAYDTTLIPNLPPKSYTVTVYDGDTGDIAKSLWNSKPAGVQMVGNTPVTITDAFGQEHIVYFSRPAIQYAWVKITYSLYDEEAFPVDGEDRMKTSVLLFGDSLTINEDVIPKRFLGDIYKNVDGLDEVTVEIALTTDPLITDPDDVTLIYTELRIPINAAQVSSFGTGRMITIQA